MTKPKASQEKAPDYTPEVNLKFIEDHIQSKAGEQANKEWNDTIEAFTNWLREHPVQHFSAMIHGTAPNKMVDLRAFAGITDEEAAAIGSFSNAFYQFGKAFRASRKEKLARQMAADLVEKVKLLP